MNISKLFRAFWPEKSTQKVSQHYDPAVDIKFSSLVEAIHKDIVEANHSLQCVGLKYIEKFFEKECEPYEGYKVLNKISDIQASVELGDKEQTVNQLNALKHDMLKWRDNNQQAIRYRPKMAEISMPVFSDGFWQTQNVAVPLLSLVPVPTTQISTLNLTSKLDRVETRDGDLYVAIKPSTNTGFPWLGKKQTDSHTEVCVEVHSEQSPQEIDDLIAHYQELLLANQTNQP